MTATSMGFCGRCRADVPSATAACPTCSACAFPLIPASWGKRQQTWTDGAWTPCVERPDGYVYTPRVVEPPARVEKRERVNDGVLGPRTSTTKPRQARTAPRPKPPRGPVQSRPCVYCRVLYFPPLTRGGRVRPYCSEACRRGIERDKDRARVRPLMSTIGLACSTCGRSDRPYKANKQCRSCYTREYMARQRAGVGRATTAVTCGHPERVHHALGMCASCHQRAYQQRRAAAGLPGHARHKTMAELGLTCSVCGHGGVREYRGLGRCFPCYMKAYRASRKEQAAS